MSMSQAQQSELIGLIESLYEQTLSADDALRLQELLAREDARRLYARYAIMRGLLQWQSTQRPAQLPSGAFSDGAERQAVSAWQAMRDRCFRRPTPLSLSIAALVMGLLITAMAWIAVPIVRHVVRGGVEIEPVKTVAQITSMSNVQWGPADLGRTINSFLVRGQTIEFAAGFVELTFHSGATVVVAGPARVQASHENALQLLAGELAAKVPAVAKGFEVRTEQATFIDLGTEFTVAMDEAKNVTLFVRNGSVAYQQTDQRPPVIVRGGEGLRVGRDGIVRRVPVEPAKTERLAPAIVRQNLIANGGFEEDFSQEGSAWKSVGTQPVYWAKASPKHKEQAVDGTCFARFGSPEIAGAVLEQHIATTPGTQYVLTYYASCFGMRKDKPNFEVVVVDGGEESAELLRVETKLDWKVGQWRTFRHRFMATSSRTTLRFAEPTTSPSYHMAPVIDAVSIVVAPDWVENVPSGPP